MSCSNQMSRSKEICHISSNKQQGNVIIEMAFSLPLFLFLLLATLEINRYFWMGYLLDYNLHQAIKKEAWEPGTGVEGILKARLNNLLFDVNKLDIQEKSVSIGQLLVDEYTVSYSARFFFLPTKDLTLNSSSWLGDNENDII